MKQQTKAMRWGMTLSLMAVVFAFFVSGGTSAETAGEGLARTTFYVH